MIHNKCKHNLDHLWFFTLFDQGDILIMDITFKSYIIDITIQIILHNL